MKYREFQNRKRNEKVRFREWLWDIVSVDLVNGFFKYASIVGVLALILNTISFVLRKQYIFLVADVLLGFLMLATFLIHDFFWVFYDKETYKLKTKNRLILAFGKLRNVAIIIGLYWIVNLAITISRGVFVF